MRLVAPASLARVEAELSRIGLLLQHDKVLPSVTTLVAGAPIAGSWWGHPRGHEIYAVLSELDERPGSLCVKLVNAKRTYVHPSLTGALCVLIEARSKRNRDSASALAKQLLQLTEQVGELRVEQAVARGVGQRAPLTLAFKELEDALLARGGSVHTDSGKHERTLQSWSSWKEQQRFQEPRVSRDEAVARLTAAVARLAAGVAKSPKLRLLSELG
jgi:hypothetical protein